MLLGILLVVLARGSRDPVTAPTTDDHWHSAYSIYNCGALMPPLSSQADPDGIHSHGDSIIHVHPYNSSATGLDARLGVFFEAMNVTVSAESILANNGEFAPILAEEGCDGGPGVIKAARWIVAPGVAPELVEVFEDNFADIRLLGDGEGFSFALVPEGADPPPPAEDVVGALAGVSPDIQWPGPEPLTTIPEDPSATIPLDTSTIPLDTSTIPLDPSTTESTDAPTTTPEDAPTTTLADPLSEGTTPVEPTDESGG